MDLETSIAHNSKVLFCDLVTFSTKLFNLARFDNVFEFNFAQNKIFSLLQAKLLRVRQHHKHNVGIG